ARIHARIRDRQAPRQTGYEQGVRDALQELVTQARGVLRPDEIVLALVRRLARAFGLAHCSYVVIAEGEDQGRIVADAGEPREGPDRLDLGRYPEIAEAARTRRPVTMPDLHGSPAWGTTPSLVVLPVPGARDVPGVLLLRSRESQPWLNSAQLDLAGSVGRAAAEALALHPLPRAVVPVTLDRRLQEEFERARRYSLSFSLVLLEMDAPGGTPAPPAAGAAEELLDEVGSRLRRELRLPDFVSHYGKGELAIVLPETGRDGARRSVARIRERLSAANLATSPSPSTDLPPFSAGIVTYPHPAVSQADDLFALVEAALMRGKGQVGDRIGVAE
ncbi:MAG: sensor domain-containing diguanylate cyclase, partial [Gemmatimonadales bacterium]